MPFRPGSEPASDRRVSDTLSRLEKAVAALDITKLSGGEDTLNKIRNAVGAARAEISRTASTGQRALGVNDLAKNAEQDIRVQRLMREAVTKSSESEQAARAAALIAKAQGRPAPNPAGVIKALQPYGVEPQSGQRIADPQTQINPSRPVVTGTAALPGGGYMVSRTADSLPPLAEAPTSGGPQRDGLPADLAGLWSGVHDYEINPLTLEPIQRDARPRITPSGEPSFRAGDVKVPEPASSDGVGLAGKAATGVDLLKVFGADANSVRVEKVLAEFRAELARIRKGASTTGVDISKRADYVLDVDDSIDIEKVKGAIRKEIEAQLEKTAGDAALAAIAKRIRKGR